MRALWIIITTMFLGGSFPGFAQDQDQDQDHDHHKSSSQMSDGEGDHDEHIHTCPMHPQIRQPGEGKCPICGMDLVPATADETDENDNSHTAKMEPSGEKTESIRISPASRRLAGIRTMVVKPKTVDKRIKAVGNITFDESRQATIPAYVNGRIEKLFADYTGVKVKKGDHLAVVYSPELYAAQVEFLQTKKSLARMSRQTIGNVYDTQQELLAGARTKLAELGMTERQIATLAKTGKAKSRMEIYAPIGGTVIDKPTAQGQYIKAGQTLFQIGDLSTVWLIIDVFPEDAGYIHYGQEVEAMIRSAPDRTFTGRVAFISPVINPKTRTVSVRVEVVNETGSLRPGDYAEATLLSPIGSQTEAGGKIFDKSLAGKWISPMHPQIIRDEPGNCPICGMELVKAETYGFASSAEEEQELIVIPRDALLRIGRTSAVFTEVKKGRFAIRQVRPGPTVDDEVVILDGLESGETIASEGVFLIDSQMQLSGKTSLVDLTAQDETNED